MKKFLVLGAFVAVALVSCKEKAVEAPVEAAPVEAAPVEAAPAAVDTTAMPADTTKH
ncbi:MAG: hypothetical protein U0T36_05510 [Saprospiraceae bacterium]|jgi:hypothetical protein